MSEHYIVSARKYRPTSFSTVVGQQALTHTLKTAIASQQLAHAYLFCGPRGVGKTTCARIFAKAINCNNLTADGEPCNQCESCKAFNEQRSYNIIELDAASNNGVDEMRELTNQVRIPPQVGRYRVFIIDEVHMLSTQAFNAFLKTLEEPPEYAIFILATTEKQKIIPTILSRCQIYDFNRIKVSDIVKQLQHICTDRGVEAETAALNVIAQKADGALRDALSIFDQVSASSEGHISYQSTIENLNVLDYDYYFRLDEAFLNSNVPEALLIYKEIRDHGFDSQFFINGLAQHIRDLMVAGTPQTAVMLEMNDDIAQRFVAEAAKFTPSWYYRAMDLCNYCDLNYRDASNKQFIVELTLIKICQLLVTSMPPTDGSPTGVKKMKSSPPATQAQPTQQADIHSQATSAPQAQQTSAQAPASHVTMPLPTPATMPQQHHQVPPTNTHSRILVNNDRVAAPIEQATPSATATATARREAFTHEQLLKAWQDYITEHPKEKIVVNTMSISLPEKVNEELYKITVQSQGQLDLINSRKTKILEFLHNAVHNDMLAIDIEIGAPDPSRYILTDREIVEGIRARHPEEMNDLINIFGLSLT